MVDEAHRAARTIDDLLELSRIELGGKALQGVVDVARRAPRRDRAHGGRGRPARACAVTCGATDQHVKAIGDSRQLVSALANMIDNAVKFSDRRQRGDGPCRRARRLGRPRGRGSRRRHPGRDLDRVFERFYRVDQARSRETGGTGLGLAIVRHVATNHGGDVVVHSEEGVGSTFTLRVPAATSAGSADVRRRSNREEI